MEKLPLFLTCVLNYILNMEQKTIMKQKVSFNNQIIE